MKSEYHIRAAQQQGMIVPPGWQRGAITIFTAVFVLILMTLMLMYATRVGVLEQRISSNDMRQKQAFHAAETALQQATEYMLANNVLANSSDSEAGPDGLNADPAGYRAGWFLDDNATRRWRACPDAPADGHPCSGDVAAVAGSFYYDTDNDDTTRESIPINTGALAANTTARAMATVCLLNIAEDGTMSCDTSEPDADDSGGTILITLMGYGYSDCTDTTDPGTCTGRATVSIPMTSLSSVAGGAGVPLVTKNTLPTTGTAEVVPNPNSGGIGVPVSVWANGRTSECLPLDDNGAESTALGHSDTSWATCEYHEWFGAGYRPDPLDCPSSKCACDTDELISGAVGGGDSIISFDIQVDSTFPCDLFEFYFGVPSSQYQLVKANAEIYSDCSGLDESSNGLIWISGDLCLINSNTIVGSEKNPVMLVIATAATDVRGGAIIYGTVFVTDVEVANATFEANGGMTVYGQVVVDAIFSKLQGTFAVVYDESVVAAAGGASGLGTLNHGWRDWGLPNIEW